MSRILVTGSTGNVGLPLLKALHGVPGVELLAAVRDLARSAQVLKRLPQVHPVFFDFANPVTYPAALAGCDRLFLLRPPQISSAFGSLIRQAERAGVQHIVFLSVQGAERNPLLPHRRTERLLETGSIPYTILRPAYFMQNFTTILRPDLIERRHIFLPAGEARFTLIDTVDIAQAAMAIFLSPISAHAGKAYTLTAQRRMTFSKMARQLSRELGTHITYISPSLWHFYRVKRREGLPRAFVLIMILLHFAPRFTAPPPVTSNFAFLTGKSPTEFPGFIAKHRAEFQSLPAHVL